MKLDLSGMNFKRDTNKKFDFAKVVEFVVVNRERVVCELVVSLAVGIAAGCITFSLLNGGKARADKLTPDVAETNVEQTAQADDQTITDDATPASGDTESEASEEKEASAESAYIGVYAAELAGMSDEEIDAIISEKAQYASKSKYWAEVQSYWQDVRGVKNSACYCLYLFDTSSQVYSASDFADVPAAVIHVAKNEIYARHGYSFKDQDLYNYFMGQAWYTPSILPADFSEDLFTEVEVKNLDMLNSIDTY